MNELLISFAWCSLQVTLVAALTWALCGCARRLSASHAAVLPATALTAIIVLTALACVPWPSSWSYGPMLVWHAETPRGNSEPNDEDDQPRSLPSIPRTPNVEAAVVSPMESPMVPTVETNPKSPDEASNEELSPPYPSESPSSPVALSTLLPQTWPWQSILLALLAIGAVAGLLQLLAGLVAAQSYRRKSCLIEDKLLHELADVLCAQLRCRARVELRETSALATAATIGWRKPLVLLPLEWRDWTTDQLRAVLAHEIAHISRNDFLACVLAQAGLSLHFYHPLVHWLVRRLRLEQELAADAAAAMATGGRAAYLKSLAELALRQSERPLGWPARTFLPTRGTFMRRIEMLRDAKNGSAGETRWLAWPRRLAMLLLIAGAVAVAGLRGGSPSAELAQAQDKPKIKEDIKVGDDAQEVPADSGEISIDQVPSDCLAFAAIRVQPLLKNPETAEMLHKVDLRTAESKAALPLEKISQISMLVSARGGERFRQVEPVIIVETTGPAEFAKALILEGGPKTDITEVKEADLQKDDDTPVFVFTRLGDKSAAFGRRREVARLLSRKRGGAPLVRGDGWKQVSGRPVVFAIDMMVMRRMFLPQEGPIEILNRYALNGFWEEPESIAIGVTLGKKADIRMVTECLGEKGAIQVEEMADAGAVALRDIFRELRTAPLRHAADNLGGRPAEEPEFVQVLFDAADKALSNVKVDRQGTLITASASVDLKGRIGALSALIPSVEAMRVDGRRAQSANNLKKIMIAMHTYVDTYNSFPPAVIYGKDGKGKVPHSWRVELLPFLNQEALYRAYQFDEPWDSEANRKVLAQMPAVFRDPGDNLKSVRSAYYVMVGKVKELKKGEEGGGAGAAAPPGGASGTSAVPASVPGGAPLATPAAEVGAGVPVDTGLPTAFSKKEGIRFSEILDGTSNTIAVVEAKRDIPWTKPEDIPYDPKGKSPKLGGFYAEGFHVGICDGSVKFLPGNISEDSLRAYLSPAAGEQIAPPMPAAGLEIRPVPPPSDRPRSR